MADDLDTHGQSINEDFFADYKAAEEAANEHYGDEAVEAEAEENERIAAANPEPDEETEDEKTETDAAEASDESDNGAHSDDDDGGDEEAPSEAEGEREELKALAEKLGYKVDKGQITVAKGERAAWRVKMNKERAELRATADQYSLELKERGDAMSQRFSKSSALEKAIEADDYDAMAKAFGHANYMAMNKSFIQKAQSPDYKERMALKARLDERDAADARREEDGRNYQAQQAQEKAQADWLEEVGEILSDGDNEVAASMAKEPDFAQYVNGVIQSHQGQISVDDAAALALDNLRVERDRLVKYLGLPESPASRANAETPDGASVETRTRRRKKSPKTISQQEATDASSSTDPDDIDMDAMLAKQIKAMQRASDVRR